MSESAVGQDAVTVAIELQTLRAEQARLRAALLHIEEHDYRCGCEHDTEDCCARLEDVEFCPCCYAHVALEIGGQQ